MLVVEIFKLYCIRYCYKFFKCFFLGFMILVGLGFLWVFCFLKDLVIKGLKFRLLGIL